MQLLCGHTGIPKSPSHFISLDFCFRLNTSVMDFWRKIKTQSMKNKLMC